MKIVFTGGGTGGHFYPIIAVIEALNDIIERENVAGAKLYYFSNEPYDPEVLIAHRVRFKRITAGKLRIYPSYKNIIDVFKMGVGVLQALVTLFMVFPDVVFAKGGYASFPTLFAARVLGIPVVIHESDSAPGRVGKWAGGFAKRVALSYREAIEYFPKGNAAHIGQPVRRTLLHPAKSGAHEYLHLELDVPVIAVFGGSSGAKTINDVLISALPELVKRYQIVHMTGRKLFEEVQRTVELALKESEHKYRYHPVDFLNPLATSMVAGAARLVITRAGSQLFEVASWQVPAIVIPRTHSVRDHNRKNAFAFARAGAGIVIEEANLTPKLLVAEIDRIIENPELMKTMSESGQHFFKPGAAERIAEEIINIALSHEE